MTISSSISIKSALTTIDATKSRRPTTSTVHGSYNSRVVSIITMANGTVRVFAGLMDLMTDDEVRYVIGHEIGHIKAGHSKARMKAAAVAGECRPIRHPRNAPNACAAKPERASFTRPLRIPPLGGGSRARSSSVRSIEVAPPMKSSFGHHDDANATLPEPLRTMNKITLRHISSEIKPAPEVTAESLLALRMRMRLSRGVLARYLRTNPRTLENWEQGRARPNAQAALLIRLVEQYPDTVERLAEI